MKQSKIPLSRTLFGFGAMVAVACGGDADDVGGSRGQLEATCEDPGEAVAEAHSLSLWPPNHKFHTVSVADCVAFTPACEGDVTGEFTWASSDEPVDDIGDGHHSPDIQLDDSGKVCVRSERQGPKNGRVYHLGVRFTDASGAITESECTIVVDHDQSAADSQDDGEAYRVTFDGLAGAADCDGEIAEPPPPVGDGDGDDSEGDGDGDDSEGDGDGDDSEGGDGDGSEEPPVEPPPPVEDPEPVTPEPL